MAPDQSTVTQGYERLMEQPPEALVSLAVLAIGAVAKAWQTYNERPQTKRIGRRASDMDCELLQRSQAKIEKEVEELSDKVDAIAGILQLLEERARPAAPP